MRRCFPRRTTAITYAGQATESTLLMLIGEVNVGITDDMEIYIPPGRAVRGG